MSYPFICFDTEDDSLDLGKKVAAGVKGVSMFDKRVTQIAAITANGKRFYCPGDVDKFLKWLVAEAKSMMREQGCNQILVYAFNIQYDLGNLFADVLDSLDCTLVGGRMIKSVWGVITFVDVWNLWQGRVADLGETFGLKKLETDSMATDKEYVFRDVEIIHAAMTYVWEFAEKEGLDYVPPTMGSLGVNLWKSWGGETIHCSQEICRDAIYGGRVELFKVGNRCNQVRYCDINSLYPTMMTREFPADLEVCKDFKRLGVAQVTMDIPECEIAVLPWRNPDGKIYYPWGKFTGVWTIAEILEAEKRGGKIMKVHDVLATDEGIFPYRSYMERVYAVRKASKSKVEKNLYKLLMNTLYGRTGTTGVIGRTVAQTDRNRSDGICFGERTLINYAMPLGEEVNWSHAAYITSYARLELLKYLEIVGAEAMIYCDTDSVIFDAPGGNIPFPTGAELGEMKIELNDGNPNWENAVIYAPKMYQVGGKFKAKGVPKKLQREYIEKGEAAFDLPYKFREAVTFFDRGNAKKLSVWRNIVKQNKANYDKKKLRHDRYFPCEISDV